MSSYVFMKVLESTPLRYDRGIRLLSRGAIDGVYHHIAERVAKPGHKVLDVGCGTGNLTMACAKKGAHVVGIDCNAGMLEVARHKAEKHRGSGSLEFVELNALELEDRFAPGSFDAAVSCLLFSELTWEERLYVLRALRRLIKPGGLVVLADEMRPQAKGARLWWRIKRVPLAGLTWLLTQTTTRAVDGLERSMQDAGFAVAKRERLAGDFVVVEASC